MDENVRHSGQTAMAVVYLFLAFPMLCLSIGALLSYPDGIWVIGILFGFSAVLLAYSGVNLLLKIKRTRIANALKVNSIVNKITSIEQSADAPHSYVTDTLIRWSFSKAEWQSFLRTQRKMKKNETIFLAILSAAIIAWVFKNEEGMNLATSTILGIIFSVGFFTLRYLLSQRVYRVNDANVEVVVDHEKIFINGKLFYFRNEERYLKEVATSKEKGLNLIEFTYAWNTRQANAEDSIIIPIPEGKMEEAEWLVKHFLG